MARSQRERQTQLHTKSGMVRSKVPRKWTVLRSTCQTCAIVVLAALSAEISKLCLSPVYGSLPASRANIWEISLLDSSKLKAKLQISLPKLSIVPLIWLSRTYLSKAKIATITDFLPIFGCCVPAIQSYLFRLSSIGPILGPIVTESCTSSLLYYFSVLSAVGMTEAFYFNNVAANKTEAPKRYTREGPSYFALFLIIVWYTILEKIQDAFSPVVSWLVGTWSGTSALFSRFGLHAILSLFYALLICTHKRSAYFGFLPVLHTFFLNPHFPSAYNTAALNETLQIDGYSLVARQESLTGYISVLDNVKDGFRAMRCDHSLLGGEWINKPEGHPAVLNEPIYVIFLMLEAIRLIETGASEARADSEKSALVIGLGVGTAPSALVAHGIATTTIEIDPVVHKFATKYFNLPQNHTSIIGDAVNVVNDMQSLDTNDNLFDYIIHDVFTGGAEPIELFTQEFLTSLSNLLNQNGVIAINYAGDMLLTSAFSSITTVMHVFPNCRLFRETPAPTPLGAEDFTNIVIFCSKSAGPIAFRQPVESDFLGSPARRQHLMPQHEVDEEFLKTIAQSKGNVIRRGQTRELRSSQMRSAIGHWYVMRGVLPDGVWESW